MNSYLTPAANGKRKADDSQFQARRSKSSRQEANYDKNRQGLISSNQFESLDETEAPSIDPTLTTKHIRMPPIVIGQDLKNPKDTLMKIRKWITNMHFKVLRGQHAIMTYNKEDYVTVMTKLDEVNITYHTYTPKSEKTRRLVLKGLPSLYTNDDLKADLSSQNSAVVNVTEMKTKNLSTNNPIYLVTFPWETSVADVKKLIRYVCDHRVAWQDYVKPKRLRGSQCFRCQRFGHVSNNCHLEQRCVKCALKHNIGECKKDSEEPPKCANCMKPHPANYRGCEAAKNYKLLIKPRRTVPVTRSSYNHQKNTVQGLYSNVLRNREGRQISQNSATVTTAVRTAAPQNVNKNNRFSTNERDQVSHKQDFKFNDFTNEIFKLFNKTFTQLAEDIKEFWLNYVKIIEENDKKMAMIQFMISLTMNSI